MHIIFEKTSDRFRSNCNILTLAWMPYYNETKFRQALFEYHQRQLLNLASAPVSGQSEQSSSQSFDNGGSNSRGAAGIGLLGQHLSEMNNRNSNHRQQQQQPPNINDNRPSPLPDNDSDSYVPANLNGRLIELQQRFNSTKQSLANRRKSSQILKTDTQQQDNQSSIEQRPGSRATRELEREYGQLNDFGWLVVGNIGRIVGITLTSVVPPPIEPQTLWRINSYKNNDSKSNGNNTNHNHDQNSCTQNDDNQPDLIVLNDINSNGNETITKIAQQQQQQKQPNYEQLRPDKKSSRVNYNLRGHLDEVILCKWNELYQKLATVDSKGNVLIWCKVNEKFTIQTPFYNRTKSVADFQWSNDGKTALICYTDSFILVGSSTGQRHWHSMLNLDDYHITCGSWTPNDEQLLLGVSNGNIVVIDLPHSDLTELVVSYANIRAMSWSNSNMTLAHMEKYQLAQAEQASNDNNNDKKKEEQRISDKQTEAEDNWRSSQGLRSRRLESGATRLSIRSSRSSSSSTTTNTGNVVNQRRLSRDCSVFSRYRFCSQPPNQLRPGPMRTQSTNDNGVSNDTNYPQRFQTSASSNINRKISGSCCSNILAIDYANNTIELFEHALDDPNPKTIHVNLESYIMQWSSDGQILAVAGFNIHTMAPSVSCIRCLYLNTLKFYNRRGELIYERPLRYTRYPITAFTWAHENTRLFVATGPRLHCAKVFFGVPKLSLLAMSCIARNTRLANKSDIWKSLTTCGLYSLNTIDWQSRNCPINLWQVYRQAIEKIEPSSPIKDKDFRIGSQLNNIKPSNYDNKVETILAIQASSSMTSSTTSGSSSSADSSSDGEQHQKQSSEMPNYHYNSNIYVHNLPPKLRLQIDAKLCSETIRQPFDAGLTPSDIIWMVPKHNNRIYCTLVCYTSDRNISQYSDNGINDVDQHSQNLLNQSPSHHATNKQAIQQDLNGAGQHISSDHFKIFVLYIEFAGSYIPILRARRVGILKPEFVIFDPQNNELERMVARRQHKVADISQQQAGLNGDMMMLRKKQLLKRMVNQQASPSHAHGRADMPVPDSLMDSPNCSDLHSAINNDRLFSRSSSSFGAAKSSIDSPSDAEQYCIFDNSYQPKSFHESNNGSYGSPIRAFNREEKLADLAQKRSHHQEPLPSMPRSSHEAYINYMISLEGGQQINSKTPLSASPLSSLSGNNQYVNRQHLKLLARIGNSSDNHQQLTEKRDLVRIKSNIWGTKFKILNESNSMIRNRSVLGSLVYKASLLHLQPRQIFLNMKDMSNYCSLCSLHHHTPRSSTKQSKSNHSNRVNCNDSANKLKISIGKRDNSNSKPGEPICLLDAPNDLDLSKTNPNSPSKTRSRIHHNKKHSTPTSANKLIEGNSQANSSVATNRCPNEKILLAVGESLRIAPSLGANQKYIHINQTPTKSLNSFSANNAHLNKDKIGLNGRAHSVNNPSSSNDHLLMLGLDRTNQVRVAMTSSPPPPQTPKRASSLTTDGADRRGVDSNTENRHNVQEKEQDALASDKTLKSIKVITQMIVDLSERSKQFDQSPGHESRDLPSPSKLIKSSSGDPKKSPLISPILSSTSYIPPDTPVHLPRRRPVNNPRLLDRLNISRNPAACTQSANSTPVKLRIKNNHNKQVDNDSTRKLSFDNQHDRLVLQPPPKTASLSSRLSSSAKHFFDDSLRSLSFNSGPTSRQFASNRASNSDVETEDCEPLVRHSRNLIKRLQLTPKKLEMTQYLGNFGRSQSALTSRSSSPNRDHHRTVDNDYDLMSSLNNKLRNQITQRFNRSSKNNDSADDDHWASRVSRNPYRDGSGGRDRAKSVLSSRKRFDSMGYDQLADDWRGLVADQQDSDSSSDSYLVDWSDDEEELINYNEMIKSDKYKREYVKDMGRVDSKKVTKNNSKSNDDRGSVLRRFHSLSKLAEWPSKSDESQALKKVRTSGLDKALQSSTTTPSKSRSKYRKKSICNHSNCCCSRELKLKNRPPLWNEVSQVYQLDFGGRVTQESAKNLQIDYEGYLALQFGRVDRCTYTLDFKYPFNAVQAMSIALASLTQRLK